MSDAGPQHETAPPLPRPWWAQVALTTANAGAAAAVAMLAVGGIFDLIQAAIPSIPAEYASGPGFQTWPGWTKGYMIAHPIWFGFVFAGGFAVVSRLCLAGGRPAAGWRGAGYGVLLFLVGSLPVFALVYASFRVSPALVALSWAGRNLAQYVVAGACVGLVTHWWRSPMVELGRFEDAEDAAKLLYETDRKFFEYLSNREPPLLRRLFADEWRRPGSPLHHTFARVIRDQGRVVGLLVGYTQDAHAKLDFTAMGCGSAGLPGGFLEHLHQVYAVAQYLFPAVPSDAFYVQNLAVAETHQKHGFGRRLMEDAFERGRALGCRTCHLDVDSRTPAVAWYRKLGMEVLVETRVPELAAEGTPTHFRMVKELE